MGESSKIPRVNTLVYMWFMLIRCRNQWTAMFPYRSSDVGSDLPLWAVQFDYKPGVSTVTTFMGGWTSALAKQYYLDTKTPECGGSLDLDSFAA